MKCNEAKILLSAELDGELSPSEEIALTKHLGTCTECAQEKAGLASLRGTMALWADEEPSEWLAQSFSYKLKGIMEEGKQEVRRPARWTWRTLRPAAAGLAMTALLVVMLVHNQPQPTANITPAPPVVSSAQPESKLAAPVKPSKQLVASDTTDKAAAPKNTVIATSTNRSSRVRHTPRHNTYRATPTTVAARPETTPDVQLDPATTNSLRSTDHGMMPSGPGAIAGAAKSSVAEVTVIGGGRLTNEDELKDNIGEAGLAMNGNVERLRGKLQEAVDLLVSKPPMPVKSTTDVDGGSK